MGFFGLENSYLTLSHWFTTFTARPYVVFPVITIYDITNWGGVGELPGGGMRAGGRGLPGGEESTRKRDKKKQELKQEEYKF